jgi:hypothetical protein
MNELAKEGFIVRDLFQSDKIHISEGAKASVLLERIQ